MGDMCPTHEEVNKIHVVKRQAKGLVGHVIGQAVSRRLPNVAPRVRARVR
jgi:hypothetical protein